jgi:uncharacterized membrane protein
MTPEEHFDQPTVTSETSIGGIRLRLLASLIALVAGIAAAVIVIELVHSTLG